MVYSHLSLLFCPVHVSFGLEVVPAPHGVAVVADFPAAAAAAAVAPIRRRFFICSSGFSGFLLVLLPLFLHRRGIHFFLLLSLYSLHASVRKFMHLARRA